MPIDAKHEDLRSLRIDRSARSGGEGEPPAWARRYILIGIAVLVLLGVVALSYRLLAHDAPDRDGNARSCRCRTSSAMTSMPTPPTLDAVQVKYRSTNA